MCGTISSLTSHGSFLLWHPRHRGTFLCEGLRFREHRLISVVFLNLPSILVSLAILRLPILRLLSRDELMELFG